MRVVVDASVIVEVALAGGVLGPLAGHELIAPPLILSEVTSTLSEMAWRKEVPPERVPAALGHLGTLPLLIRRPDGLAQRAWEIASRLAWAKTYDAEYVALALDGKMPLVTLDGRLARGVAHLITAGGPVDIAHQEPGG